MATEQITEYSLVVIFITMSLSVDHFFSIENMLGLALSISQIGMVVCTMMFCLPSHNYPYFSASSKPSRISVSLTNPRQTTILPGGGSLARAR